jgi:predicted  nucleic acid-binding Zn-ribbon protein
MKAPALDQAKLLVVQAHDTALHRLEHKRAHLPALERLRAARAAETSLEEASALARSQVKDIERELTRLEDEIEKVAARTIRDQARLESGGGQSRELQALQQELETLARRRGRLEDEALAVMERLEEDRAAAARLAAGVERLGAEAAGFEAELAAAGADLDQAAAVERAARDAAATGLDAALVTLYERLRERLGGVGAAALAGGRCQGCGMQLSASDLAELARLEADDVARCEECTRILVRGQDSGL